MHSGRNGKKMKVLFFYPNEYIGPEMTVYAQIIRHLDRTRFEPYLALNEEAGGDLKLSEADGVTIKRWKFGFGLRGGVGQALRSGARLPVSIASLAKYMRRERIDILQCSAVPRVGTLALLLARLSGAKLLLHYHVIPGRYAGLRGFTERLAARHADRAVAVSQFMADRVRQHTPGIAVDVVANGVDCQRFHPAVDGRKIRKEYEIADDEVLVLQLARIIQQKRQEDTIRAFSLARRQVPNLRLLLVGWEDPRYDGPFAGYKAELEHIRAQANLGDSLIIAEARPEAPELVAACDIVAMPSIEDAWNLAVTEAMAGGKPVIGTDSGGIPEQIVEGVTGFLVPVKSPEELAQRMVTLARDPDLRMRFGQAGRRRAELQFNETHVASGFASTYQTIDELSAISRQQSAVSYRPSAFNKPPRHQGHQEHQGN
jgi:glycosyltransferase involved in cell wall biosynthesis